MRQFVDLHSARLKVTVWNFFGVPKECDVMLVSPLKEEYCEVSLKDKGGGCQWWLCKIDNEQLIPIKCSMFLTQPEYDRFLLMDRLHIDRSLIHEQMLDRWIDGDKDNSNNDSNLSQ